MENDTAPPPAYADKEALIQALSRITGLADAVRVILESESDEKSKRDAMRAVGDTLVVESTKLLTAAEGGEVIVVRAGKQA